MERETKFIYRFSFTVAAVDVEDINVQLTLHGYGPCIYLPLSETGAKEDVPTHYTGIITLDETGLGLFRRLFDDLKTPVEEKNALDPVTKEYLSINEITESLDLKYITPIDAVAEAAASEIDVAKKSP